MWMVHPSMNREVSIIHVDSIFCAAHLVPMFGDRFIPAHIDLHHVLVLLCLIVKVSGVIMVYLFCA